MESGAVTDALREHRTGVICDSRCGNRRQMHNLGVSINEESD